MAIYHANTKAISRSQGHSSTANAAYIGGKNITDSRTGEIFNYTRKGGVLENEIVLPTGLKLPELTSQELWNKAEKSEKRKDARVGREWEISLPHELNQEQRAALAKELTQNIANRYGVACEYAIHHPSREGSDERNHHVHILTTTRKIDHNGQLGDKSDIELDRKQCAQKKISTSQEQITEIRAQIADTINKHLSLANVQELVSHKSLAEQGIDREPTKHKGKSLCEQERRLNAEEQEIIAQIANDGDELAKLNAELELLEKQKKEQEKRVKQAQELQKISQVENGKKDEPKTVETPQNFITGKYKNELFNVAFEHNNFFTKRYEDNRSFYESIDKKVVVYKDIVRVRHITEYNIKLALDSAICQFGNQLALTGSDKFIGECLQNLASDDKYNDVQLSNPAQQLELDKLRVRLHKDKSLELINNENVLQHFEKINPELVAKIRKDGCVDAPWCYVPLDYENPEKLAKYLINKCNINVTLIQPNHGKMRTETHTDKPLNFPNNESVLQYFERINPEIVAKIRKDECVDVPGCYVPLDRENPEKLAKYLSEESGIKYVAPNKEQSGTDRYYNNDIEM